ncbi:MAG: hypothetical protein OXE74_04460, partial [Cyanobacteria bacterium MAG CAR2_bin_4]|nr:hypothetical protein [Cyanobacteria bacterium MAG CAR2_bin_4]
MEMVERRFAELEQESKKDKTGPELFWKDAGLIPWEKLVERSSRRVRKPARGEPYPLGSSCGCIASTCP